MTNERSAGYLGQRAETAAEQPRKGGVKNMTYEEFRGELLKELEEKKEELGYDEIKYYADGFTSEDPVELIKKNDYDLLKEKIFIRLLNFNDHRYEFKDHVYRRIGDMAFVLYLFVSEEHVGERHDVMSIKLPRTMMESWDLSEDEVWDNALTNTYVMSPPRMYLNPMDTYKPPYHRGAFMAVNSNITSLSAMAVPTITTTQMNGAIAMFYPGVMERIAELFRDDYYIAFTSIHDARVHKKGIISPRQILGTLKDTNKAFDPADTLSYKVSLYEAATKKFSQLEL